MKLHSPKSIFLILAVVLYLGSLLLPSIVYKPGKFETQGSIQETCNGDPACVAKESWPDLSVSAQTDYGYDSLLIGWLGAFIGMFAWFANLFFVTGIGLSFGTPRAALAVTFCGFLLGLQSFMLSIVPADEGGVMEWHVDHLGIGFYVWMLSFVFLGMHCLAQNRKRKAGKVRTARPF